LRKYLVLSGRKKKEGYCGASITKVELASWDSSEKIRLVKGRVMCRALRGWGRGGTV
jgi:hypothetical protein